MIDQGFKLYAFLPEMFTIGKETAFCRIGLILVENVPISELGIAGGLSTARARLLDLHALIEIIFAK